MKFEDFYKARIREKSKKKGLLALKNQNLKTVRAYNVKLSLQEFRDSKNRKEVTQYLKKWNFLATHSKLTPITEAANMVKKH